MSESRPAGEAGAFAVFLDLPARIFLLLVTAGVAVLTGLGIHGSSMGLLARYNALEAYRAPLLGEARDIRMDEWGHFTPALLYQLRRRDRLGYGESVFGPANAALLANLPTRHWSTFFRPQFWPFFVMPDRYAFAAWWQLKGWILLVGLFLLLKVFVRSSGWAIFGALWFYFSSFTQWWFSSPTAMPEMVGLLGFVVVGMCYLMVGRDWRRLAAAGVLTGGCVVNFVLCLYVSFLVPLVLVGAALVAAFAAGRWAEVSRREFLVRRVAAAGMCALVAAGALSLFFGDIRGALGILRQTVYPGMRVAGGGEVSVAALASDALSLWESAGTHFPASLVNVCEAAGFLWVGPIVIVLGWMRRRARRRDFRATGREGAAGAGGDAGGDVGGSVFVAAGVMFCVLLLWMLLPRAAGVEAALGLNHVSSHRAIVALGLLDICLTVLYLRSWAPKGCLWSGRGLLGLAVASGGMLVVAGPLLLLVNARFGPEGGPGGGLLPVSRVMMAAGLFSVLGGCLIARRRRLFAALTLLSVIWANALINPVERGLGAVDRSALHRLASRAELHRGRWIVFSGNVAAAPFFSANGFDVFNCARFVPDLEAMHLLDPGRRYENVYNQAGYLLARPERAGAAAAFETKGFFVNQCAVDPLDARLKRLGVRFAAFDERLDAALIPAGLKREEAQPVDGFWIVDLGDDKSVLAGRGPEDIVQGMP